ncbi:MAG TPA: Qat anti-phage system associated protein QatB [Gemmataceae bacterium]|nr:Qat anti-phage system associated protein QatB [Gemmataceae bacterium]
MVPPWVPDAAPDDVPDGVDDNASDQQAADTPNAPAASPQPAPVAPPGRFGPSRSSLGHYARSGSTDDMRRGLGHYVGKGLGGSGTAVRRFAGTARTAGTLYGALSSAASGQAAAPGSPFDPALLAGRTAREIMDAAVEAVRPTDGTQDAEASRQAIRDALSELLNRYPDADLLNLSEDQRVFAIERFVAVDVFNRFRLDVGKAIQDKAPTIAAALARFKEVKDYIKETVSAAFRHVRAAGQALNVRRITLLVSRALAETFQVFEDYLQ